jgi:alpha-galactosidase
MAVGLFNRDLVARTVTVRWSDLGLGGEHPVRDLWQQRDLGPRREAFAAVVPRHGVVLVRIGTPVRPRS